MTTEPNPLNLANVLAAVFATYASPTLASALGAYAAIILSSVAGAGWALTRSQKDRTMRSTLGYAVLLVLTSTIITVVAATLAQAYLPSVSTEDLLAPMALFIAAVGDDWPTMAKGAVSWVANRFGGPARKGDRDG